MYDRMYLQLVTENIQQILSTLHKNEANTSSYAIGVLHVIPKEIFFVCLRKLLVNNETKSERSKKSASLGHNDSASLIPPTTSESNGSTVENCKSPDTSQRVLSRTSVLGLMKKMITVYSNDPGISNEILNICEAYYSHKSSHLNQIKLSFIRAKANRRIKKLKLRKRRVEKDKENIQFLSKYKAKDIAEQLCYISENFFKQINIKEFQLKGTKRTLTTMSKFFNILTTQIVYEILLETSVKGRGDLITFFIILARELEKYKNFDMMLAVICALNNSNIQRLKLTWKSITDNDLLVLYDDYSELLSPMRNFANYRVEIENLIEKKTPYLPILSVKLKDIMFMEEGNPSILEGGPINTSKITSIGKILEDVILPNSFYHFAANEYFLEQILSPIDVSEEELMELSDKVEPFIPTSPSLNLPLPLPPSNSSMSSPNSISSNSLSSVSATSSPLVTPTSPSSSTSGSPPNSPLPVRKNSKNIKLFLTKTNTKFFAKNVTPKISNGTSSFENPLYQYHLNHPHVSFGQKKHIDDGSKLEFVYTPQMEDAIRALLLSAFEENKDSMSFPEEVQAQMQIQHISSISPLLWSKKKLFYIIAKCWKVPSHYASSIISFAIERMENSSAEKSAEKIDKEKTEKEKLESSTDSKLLNDFKLDANSPIYAIHRTNLFLATCQITNQNLLDLGVLEIGIRMRYIRESSLLYHAFLKPQLAASLHNHSPSPFHSAPSLLSLVNNSSLLANPPRRHSGESNSNNSNNTTINSSTSLSPRSMLNFSSPNLAHHNPNITYIYLNTNNNNNSNTNSTVNHNVTISNNNNQNNNPNLRNSGGGSKVEAKTKFQFEKYDKEKLDKSKAKKQIQISKSRSSTLSSPIGDLIIHSDHSKMIGQSAMTFDIDDDNNSSVVELSNIQSNNDAIDQWKWNDIKNWMMSQGLDKYIDLFHEHQITDGKSLQNLNAKMLAEFGINVQTNRAEILMNIRRLQLGATNVDQFNDNIADLAGSPPLSRSPPSVLPYRSLENISRKSSPPIFSQINNSTNNNNSNNNNHNSSSSPPNLSGHLLTKRNSRDKNKGTPPETRRVKKIEVDNNLLSQAIIH